LGQEETKKFSNAVANQYWYQLFLGKQVAKKRNSLVYIDDLPIWGMVGEVVSEPGQEDKLYIYTHKKFVVTYNGDRVIEVNLTSENPVLLERGAKLDFTYSVTWYPTNIPFESRFEKYLDYNFFEHQVRHNEII
jgi:transmembrane 9 superfamily protein 3